MFGELWDWMVEKMENLTENMKEYKRRWEAEHKEKRRSQNLEAVRRYQEKKIQEDPEAFREYRNAASRESMKKSYAKKRAAMTPEELEEYRRKTRERVARIRAEKKARAAAAAESKPEE